MLNAKRKLEAHQNFSNYLAEGLIKKEKNIAAENMYLKNGMQQEVTMFLPFIMRERMCFLILFPKKILL